MTSKKLFVITGPSGVGKTTLIQALLASNSNMRRAITCTTRSPRSNEKEGIDYFFTQRESFQDLIDQSLLAEWEEIHNCYYGSLKSEINSIFEKELTPIITVGVQGACSLSALYQSVLIFIEPPSPDVLEKRLLTRGEEDQESIMIRLKKGQEMMSFRERYDYTIVCGDLAFAFDLLQKIVKKEQGQMS